MALVCVCARRVSVYISEPIALHLHARRGEHSLTAANTQTNACIRTIRSRVAAGKYSLLFENRKHNTPQDVCVLCMSNTLNIWPVCSYAGLHACVCACGPHTHAISRVRRAVGACGGAGKRDRSGLRAYINASVVCSHTYTHTHTPTLLAFAHIHTRMRGYRESCAPHNCVRK